MSVTSGSTHPLPGGTGLRIEGVDKTYPVGVQAVASLSLEVKAGSFVALIGPSGCGKSTLLRMIAGMETPTVGRIRYDRPPASPDPRHREIAYVFQDAHLLPWRNVLCNVSLPLELAGVRKADRNQAAEEVLQQVGLAEFAGRYPNQLSGGQRMRVSLARALISRPSLLLLDEPFAALDEITRQQLDSHLRDLWRERGMTVIFVTHSIAEATFLSERAIVLSPRPASITVDHDLSSLLPRERAPSIRGTPLFAEQTRVLYDALEAAERRSE